MKKNQLIAIAAMIVAAALFAAFVLVKGGGGHVGRGESEEHGTAAGDAHQASEKHAERSAAQDASHPQKQEGKVELSAAQMQASGITVETAGPARIVSAVRLPGEIRFNNDRTAHVVPRLDGVVETVPASLGQVVAKGQTLAVISSPAISEQRSTLLAAEKRLEYARTTYAREKQLWEEKISATQDYQKAQQDLREAEIAAHNARQQLTAIGAGTASGGALNRFVIKAPFAGTIIEKHISLGEGVRSDTNVFTLSDLGEVWAEIDVPAKDLDKVRVGSQALVQSTASATKAVGKIGFVGSLIGEQTRSAKARVVLQNPGMAWRPGLFVNVDVTFGDVEVPVAVAKAAIQTIGDRPAVFIQVPGGFVAQPVVLGRSDDRFVEIDAGLKPGSRYAADGSFVLKAELGKGSGGDEH